MKLHFLPDFLVGIVISFICIFFFFLKESGLRIALNGRRPIIEMVCLMSESGLLFSSVWATKHSGVLVPVFWDQIFI